MKYTFKKHAKLSGIALAAMAALSMLETGAAQAANFAIAGITVNSVGFLDAAFKETGLGAGASINYTSGATDVGWLTQCFVRSKPVANIAPRLHVAHAADGLTTDRTLLASNRGTISSSILTAYPTAAENEGVPPLCPEVEGVTMTEEITAIRWCNATLTDTTTPLQGATMPELFLQITRNGTGTVPGCGALPGMPTNY
ncbi:hypothetical protein [Sulfurirhabdus autotrophica]|uniref:Ribosomally synthesized peptide with SipW-like signal peptide n=1 Tax=Sulfurirhabdus autotrophica TaxID=1706046 RepID=A0A4R3YFE4_9PROT|nr:hypothetical protein [Sulfurirhabdus autotrophica]TCV89634.1 hypothetical protein EDC63_102154 [Sulfurirhabdus autotrophica]